MMLAAAAPAADGLVPVTLLTSWFAQAEHGGFYAAKAAGLYEKHGLDVTIQMGGPQVNGSQLLAAGRVDFSMGYGLHSLNAVREGVPIVTVAAFFQKDPQTLIAHRAAGHEKLADLKGFPVRVPDSGRVAYWPWLKAVFGFSDEQLQPYDYSMGPFAADPGAAQQGYVTEDGYRMEQVGVDGQVFLLADNGWLAYAATIDTTAKTIAQRPDVVKAFVAASAEGWKRYFEDPAPADALIQKDNPENSPELSAYKRKTMQGYGLIGEHPGMMTDARWKAYFESMVQAGVLPADLDYRKAYSLQFVEGL
jgi:NitT/TauT family transport system substrate-binding protein